jgi:PGF-CTERM protein
VTVDSANLSEDGFVVVLNESGRNPDAVRGATYLESGSHEDVRVAVTPAVTDEEELYAQVHLDTNGDQRFDYDGGLADRPFENRDGAVMATDSARVTYSEGAATPTESDGANATATPTGTATSTDTPGGPDETPDGGDGDTPGDGDASTGNETNGTADGETENGTEGDAAGDEAGDGQTADDGEATAEDGAGFGLATALVALLGGSLLMYRRSSEADGKR